MNCMPDPKRQRAAGAAPLPKLPLAAAINNNAGTAGGYENGRGPLPSQSSFVGTSIPFQVDLRGLTRTARGRVSGSGLRPLTASRPA